MVAETLATPVHMPFTPKTLRLTWHFHQPMPVDELRNIKAIFESHCRMIDVAHMTGRDVLLSEQRREFEKHLRKIKTK